MSATSRTVAAGAVLAVVSTALAGTVAPATAATPSTTTVALSTTQSAYGQTVTATAAVATVPGPPQGDVVFSVDGLAFSANLGASGTATIVLPSALVGEHQVTATFVPQFPTSQQGSTSPVQWWVVTQVRTRLQLLVTGKGARIPTALQVKAEGEFGSLPTGRVKMVLHRLGTRRWVRHVQPLSALGVVRADFGTLHEGRYRLRVRYAGDAQHLAERRVTWFKVRRR